MGIMEALMGRVSSSGLNNLGGRETCLIKKIYLPVNRFAGRQLGCIRSEHHQLLIGARNLPDHPQTALQVGGEKLG